MWQCQRYFDSRDRPLEMADASHNADLPHGINGGAVHHDEGHGGHSDEHDEQEQEQEAGSQTTEEEVPPRETTASPSADPQERLPAPEVPLTTAATASTGGSGRPKPQYKLKYTMAGELRSDAPWQDQTELIFRRSYNGPFKCQV